MLTWCGFMAKMIVRAYEDKQRELTMENSDLTGALNSLQARTHGTTPRPCKQALVYGIICLLIMCLQLFDHLCMLVFIAPWMS